MGSSPLIGEPTQPYKMKIILLIGAFLALAFCDPTADPTADPNAEADPYYASYYGYGARPYAYGGLRGYGGHYGYGGHEGYGLGYYGRKKRSAEPSADPTADPTADPNA